MSPYAPISLASLQSAAFPSHNREWEADVGQLPVIEREASDRDVLEMALIENLQREDLNPIEEAAGYVRLSKEFSMKQDEIAGRVGKSRASVANAKSRSDVFI